MSIFGNSRKPATPASTKIPPYTIKTAADDVAEIILYGDIVERQPINWWTGEPVEGSFIILGEFLEDLKRVESSRKIHIRIHSAGGDAYDAITIHNRLKELVGKGKKIEVTVDGVAMSGGSLIMCAANKVKVFPGSLIMIHCCWGFMFGGYGAQELQKTVEHFDAVDRSQAAVYHAKTGLSQDALMEMMRQETYMTGQEAIDKGFADELVKGSALQIAASADRKTLYVSGEPVWQSMRDSGIPPNINIPVFPTAAPMPAHADGINNNQPAQTGGNEGGKPMPTTLEELRAQNPDLADQLMAEAQAAVSAELEEKVSAAVRSERDRIKEIDEISASLADDDLVNEAKFGEKPCTAQELSHQVVLKVAKTGETFMSNLKSDAKSSGADDVTTATPPEDVTTQKGSKEELEKAGAKAAIEHEKMMGRTKDDE